MKIYNKHLNVYQAAKNRIKEQILFFPDFYVSFSGGKDSGVLINLVLEVATELNRLPVKCVFSDLEVIFQETARYTESIMEDPRIKPFWLCIEELDDNASSVFQRYFKIWDESKKDFWVRPMPNKDYVINKHNLPEEFAKYLELNRLEYWSIECFGEYLCDISGVETICNFIGMRTEESYGRHMAIAVEKHRTKRNEYTYLTKNNANRTWTCLPIFDWLTKDVWKYYSDNNLDYNRVYDSMFKAGLPISEMRTCSAFGEEQKKSLWLWKIIEPSTFDRMLQRVEGVNFGANYNHTNINRGKIVKPKNITWKEYLKLLIAELPNDVAENFEEKFSIVFKYHRKMYCDKMGLDFEFISCDSKKEAKEKAFKNNMPIKYFFSYETLCGAVIRRDFVFKKYGFGYSNKMSKRIEEIQEKWNQEL